MNSGEGGGGICLTIYIITADNIIWLRSIILTKHDEYKTSISFEIHEMLQMPDVLVLFEGWMKSMNEWMNEWSLWKNEVY